MTAVRGASAQCMAKEKIGRERRSGFVIHTNESRSKQRGAREVWILVLAKPEQALTRAFAGLDNRALVTRRRYARGDPRIFDRAIAVASAKEKSPRRPAPEGALRPSPRIHGRRRAVDETRDLGGHRARARPGILHRPAEDFLRTASSLTGNESRHHNSRRSSFRSGTFLDCLHTSLITSSAPSRSPERKLWISSLRTSGLTAVPAGIEWPSPITKTSARRNPRIDCLRSPR